MYPVLIGSRALQHWVPELKLKPSTDWDVISYGTQEGLVNYHAARHIA